MPRAATAIGRLRVMNQLQLESIAACLYRMTDAYPIDVNQDDVESSHSMSIALTLTKSSMTRRCGAVGRAAEAMRIF